jgi:hypothetical protein
MPRGIGTRRSRTKPPAGTPLSPPACRRPSGSPPCSAPHLVRGADAGTPASQSPTKPFSAPGAEVARAHGVTRPASTRPLLPRRPDCHFRGLGTRWSSARGTAGRNVEAAASGPVGAGERHPFSMCFLHCRCENCEHFGPWHSQRSHAGEGIQMGSTPAIRSVHRSSKCLRRRIWMAGLAALTLSGCNCGTSTPVPAISSFKATPASIVSGGSSTLAWSVSERPRSRSTTEWEPSPERAWS